MGVERTDEETGFERTTHGVSRLDLHVMGERAVRDELNSGKYGHAGLAPFEFVSAWLKDAEFVRVSSDSARRNEREEETLELAKEASRIASRAERWAMYAAIAAVVALIISIANQK